MITFAEAIGSSQGRGEEPRLNLVTIIIVLANGRIPHLRGATARMHIRNRGKALLLTTDSLTASQSRVSIEAEFLLMYYVADLTNDNHAAPAVSPIEARNPSHTSAALPTTPLKTASAEAASFRFGKCCWGTGRSNALQRGSASGWLVGSKRITVQMGNGRVYSAIKAQNLHSCCTCQLGNSEHW